MNRKRTLLILCLLALGALLLSAAAAPQLPTILTHDLVFREFDDGTLQGLIQTEDGLQPAADRESGTYLSPVLSAPLPFNALVPSWSGRGLDAHEMVVQLRTRRPEDAWSPWFVLTENHDWTLPEDDDIVGGMLAVPAQDWVHSELQFAITLSQEGAAVPQLTEFRLTLIDSVTRFVPGPNDDLPPAAPDGFPKPDVVGRDVWCTDAGCNYSSGLAYEPVSHLIVHHTVTANGASDYEAIVRAIWNFHTYTRGWGDIGYNYLVDPHGVIYEGHNGGDDVIGTHASGANAGSMGVALIGTFTDPNENPPGIVPPPVMLDSLNNLLAWKADEKDIDVFSSSYLAGLGRGMPNLGGHRDAYGTTSCPGNQAHDLLPEIRQDVANLMGFVSPHLYVDDLSSAFTASTVHPWYDGPYGCGFDQHARYTFTVTDGAESTNWGRWQPTISNAGRYEVEILAPFCNYGESDTRGARYEVHHANGLTHVTINQGDNLGEWQSLGEFDFHAGSSGYVFLSDVATDNDRGILFDAIRLRYVPPTAQNALPPLNAWSGSRTVSFQWILSNPATIASQNFQVATDSAFNNLVVNQTLSGSATTTGFTFAQDYNRLYWRVQLTATDGSLSSSPATWFGVDTVAPASSVTQIIGQVNGHLVISAPGSDGGSGVTETRIEYQLAGSTIWTPLTVAPGSHEVLFIPPPSADLVWFRSQAVDAAGNVEPLGGADLSTAATQFYGNGAFLADIPFD